MGSRATSMLCCTLLAACASPPETRDPAAEPKPGSCAAGERAVEGHCLAAGVQDDGCPAGEVALPSGDGCRPAGIPPEACGAGFEASDGGCRAILPDADCAPGLVALPGETTCRELAPCGTGTWGEIPVEPDTQYVDAAYLGGASDGTPAKPWTSIQAGVDAASSGAIVAVAAGKYVGAVLIDAGPVRLWGRCPAMVEISAAVGLTIRVAESGSGTEVRDLAIRGTGAGVHVLGADDVHIARAWIHDTGAQGVEIDSAAGTRITGSLIERTRIMGVVVKGSEATIESTIVRDIEADPSTQTFGWGIGVGSQAVRSRLALTSSVIERATGTGLGVTGADVEVTSTVVKSTAPRPLDQAYGRGVGIEDDAGSRAVAAIRSSVIEDNREFGIFVGGSDATIDSTVVRDTAAMASTGEFGRGIEVQASAGGKGTLSLTSSLVERCREVGVFGGGADLEVVASAVRDMIPQLSDSAAGRGIAVQGGPGGEESTLALRSSAVLRTLDIGVWIRASRAEIQGTVVADTEPAPNLVGGVGVAVTDDTEGAPGSAMVSASVIERSRRIGLFMNGSEIVVEATRISTVTEGAAGNLGDGVDAFAESNALARSAVIRASRIEGAARAGIATFGVGVELGDTRLECNAIHLDAEDWEGVAGAFDSLGGNVCGCEDEAATCKVLSAHLTPPEPIQ